MVLGGGNWERSQLELAKNDPISSPTSLGVGSLQNRVKKGHFWVKNPKNGQKWSFLDGGVKSGSNGPFGYPLFGVQAEKIAFGIEGGGGTPPSGGQKQGFLTPKIGSFLTLFLTLFLTFFDQNLTLGHDLGKWSLL